MVAVSVPAVGVADGGGTVAVTAGVPVVAVADALGVATGVAGVAVGDGGHTAKLEQSCAVQNTGSGTFCPPARNVDRHASAPAGPGITWLKCVQVSRAWHPLQVFSEKLNRAAGSLICCSIGLLRCESQKVFSVICGFAPASAPVTS